MQLPPTYYDVVIKNHPEIRRYLLKDLTTIAQKRLTGPFDSDHDFCSPVDSWLNHITVSVEGEYAPSY